MSTVATVGWAKRSVPTTFLSNIGIFGWWARREERLCPPYDCGAEFSICAPLRYRLRKSSVHSRSYSIQRNISTETLDEGDTLIGIDAYLMAKAITEGPNHQIILGAGVFKRVCLGIAGQVADAVARPHGNAIITVMKRPGACHHDQNLFLEQMSMPSRRIASRTHGLNGKTDRDASERAADIGHLRDDRSSKAIVEWFDIPHIEFAKRHRAFSAGQEAIDRSVHPGRRRSSEFNRGVWFRTLHDEQIGLLFGPPSFALRTMSARKALACSGKPSNLISNKYSICDQFRSYGEPPP